ncbi:DEAD/DEAH box helicase family protein [Colwellia sp. 1_MG-2023]|jgi:superfamily II DNA or RNA helicase|uniref:DEAD/DEAH box helicase n=1 Tax=unclassified Colwellia TaxID=196834 RepID=UPI001C08230D|nr:MULTISPECIES: DEAD/DEAH box helicase family protein [unclassified Colwellia]MBU2925252.1 DEAD/DEAH box helicase family protein [Colwellia sp. C2M11]MDO6651224.1 DEAD/DEAH box helicase family protein [Colwellia sp. 3_MG-2023]MDO6664354.1 DEAD/DEAH box helicase family protein [Colwellia sp. 2_MG-2023]MDO6688533.1 DEAD/DEAH box helicase family protein [Colwellia sp. 1_MG-2023]
MKLREWQKECINLAIEKFKTNRHFLCLATPAAGKTRMAAVLSKKLKNLELIDFVICFSPSLNVANSIKSTFSEELDARFDGVIGAVGKSYTYQSMLHLTEEFWDILASHKVLVIFDEIHHCAGDSEGNVNAWGEPILSYIKNKATYTLALSGTPWRSDTLPITLSEYSDLSGKIKCDYIYGLSQAIKDKVCRTPHIVLVDNENIVITKKESDTQTFTSFIELFNKNIISYSELVKNTTALKYILGRAIDKLQTIRRTNSNAGGLIVASSVTHANDIYNLMTLYFNQDATVVTHKQANATDIINNYRQSQQAWIISVGMISEGTDIPRLQVCCHLSRVKTELYFRQILGRILRITQTTNEKAWLYTFSEPSLSEFAHRLNQEVPNQNILKNEYFSSTDTGNQKYNSHTLNNNEYGDDTEDTVISLFDQKDNSEHTSQIISYIDIVGDFRQQLIATFNSPF